MSKEGEQPVRTLSDLWQKFQRAAYRKAFVRAEAKRVIPFQISAIRKARGWSQEELARRSGLTQGVISRAEDPDYGNLTVNTAVRIANGFDIAFVGKFVPYSELGKWHASLSEAVAGDVPSFDVENAKGCPEETTATAEAIGRGPAPSPPVHASSLVFSSQSQHEITPYLYGVNLAPEDLHALVADASANQPGQQAHGGSAAR